MTIARVERTRTIQVKGAFTAETYTGVEQADLSPEEDASAWRLQARRRLDAELDAWEAYMRGNDKALAAMRAEFGYGLPPADFTTADKVQRAAPTAKSEEGTAPPTRSTPPPSAMRDVQDGTADELRRIGGRLATLGKPYEGGMPASEAEAQALIPVLRQQIHALEKPTAPAATAPTMPGPPAPPKLFCSDARNHRVPAGIDQRVHDYSVSRYGRPLCLSCQRRNA